MHHFGILLQLIALTILPMVVLFQLNFGIKLVTMPVVTMIGIVIFIAGTQLRERFK
jgi:hypothetical protein